MMFHGDMTMSFYTPNRPTVLAGSVNKNRTQYRTISNPSIAVQISSIIPLRIDESGNLVESKKISSSGAALTKCQTSNCLLDRQNTVGIIGGVSVYSTLIFLEKLVRWSSRNGQECIPFVVCSDPVLPLLSSCHSLNSKKAKIQLNHGPIAGNLRHKRALLEQSGACCIVMPCHLSHAWHREISEGCSLPFLHVGECVARELRESNLKPLVAGSNVRIGVLATDEILMAGFYQEKLQNQGFEVVLPDKATMEHIINPAIEALSKRDVEGARNLLRIAVHVLLVRAANCVILASDEMQGLLPRNDPLRKKCINPMDALARSTVKWAKSIEKRHYKA